jgi:hypothetical protein
LGELEHAQPEPAIATAVTVARWWLGRELVGAHVRGCGITLDPVEIDGRPLARGPPGTDGHRVLAQVEVRGVDEAELGDSDARDVVLRVPVDVAAVREVGFAGLEHDVVPTKVFDQLGPEDRDAPTTHRSTVLCTKR